MRVSAGLGGFEMSTTELEPSVASTKTSPSESLDVGAAVVARTVVVRVLVARKGFFISSGNCEGEIVWCGDRYASGSAGTGGEADDGYSV